jgi:hypothetical protein
VQAVNVNETFRRRAGPKVLLRWLLATADGSLRTIRTHWGDEEALPYGTESKRRRRGPFLEHALDSETDD